MSVIRQRLTIAHVIHQLNVGGLENGLINLINRLPSDRFCHRIVCLTDYSDFRSRLQRDVPVYALRKQAGQDVALYFRLWRIFRRLRPDIVHTRNLATLEAQIPAWLAGVPYRVHGEHGRDVHDLDNTRRRYRLMRRTLSPLIHRFIPLSLELERYLQDEVGIPGSKITRICNGVDTVRFAPRQSEDERPEGFPFISGERVVIGSLGRMEPVKSPMTLARAFALAADTIPDGRQRLALAMVGGGSQLPEVRAFLAERKLLDIAWLPGNRDDAPGLLKWFDIFVLPSLAEGISNTILEAMASGLPVIATDVGGNGELVAEGCSGVLVPRDEPSTLAEAIAGYVANPFLRRQHAAEGRLRAEREFSLGIMVQKYASLYEQLAGAL